MEESRTAEDNMGVVEGMQFDRGYISPYFVTDPERMVGPLCLVAPPMSVMAPPCWHIVDACIGSQASVVD